MITHSSQKKAPKKAPKKTQKKTLLRQLGTLLTGDRTPPTPVSDVRNQPTTIETNVVLPFSPPPVFIDYASEGDEPADLALIDLIPTGLKALNRPYIPTAESAPQTDASVVNNVCLLTERPTNPEIMNQAVVAADLTELTPIELSSLNIAPQPSTSKSLQKSLTLRKEHRSTTVRENALEQNDTNQSTADQITSQTSTNHSFTAGELPLPDLSTLKKIKPEQPNSQTDPNAHFNASIETIRVPTAYLNQLEHIVEGLLQQQNQQSRHNEQLGGLVKQLLSRIAQQQIELSRLGQGDYRDVQKMIQTCLTQS